MSKVWVEIPRDTNVQMYEGTIAAELCDQDGNTTHLHFYRTDCSLYRSRSSGRVLMEMDSNIAKTYGLNIEEVAPYRGMENYIELVSNEGNHTIRARDLVAVEDLKANTVVEKKTQAQSIEQPKEKKMNIKAGTKETVKSVGGSFIEGAKDAGVEKTSKAIIEQIAVAFEKSQPAFSAFIRTSFGQSLMMAGLGSGIHWGAATGTIPLKPEFLKEVSLRATRAASRNATEEVMDAFGEIMMNGFMELGQLQDKFDGFAAIEGFGKTQLDGFDDVEDDDEVSLDIEQEIAQAEMVTMGVK